MQAYPMLCTKNYQYNNVNDENFWLFFRDNKTKTHALVFNQVKLFDFTINSTKKNFQSGNW